MNNAAMQSLMNDIIDMSKELLSLRDENRELKSENAELEQLKSDLPSIIANAIIAAAANVSEDQVNYDGSDVTVVHIDDLIDYAELVRSES